MCKIACAVILGLVGQNLALVKQQQPQQQLSPQQPAQEAAPAFTFPTWETSMFGAAASAPAQQPAFGYGASAPASAQQPMFGFSAPAPVPAQQPVFGYGAPAPVPAQ
eukprot:gnl/MRDRNA2_/MRDRNA2_84451_c0_seq8.p2 gnl/MRDRNA2_/MRDRNA2_84451_c0~~gnl/MRDRNA2_/MRDRNA2_84451_c0_seq8.p2  ORF type:complete len:107 (+),score=25.84 gnl/MRDRNA2_/MRDRNA2_84451_c0_seq8:127-447(+)